MKSFLTMLGVNVANLLMLGGVLALLPRFRRPELFFAVTVAPDFPTSEAGRTIERSYRRRVIYQALGWFGLSLLMAGAGAWVGEEKGFGQTLLVGSIPIASFGQLAGAIHAFIRARRQVLPHAVQPSRVREVSMTVPPEESVGPGLMLLRLGLFFIIIASALYLWLRWEAIPARFPSHWGVGGKVDGWTTRTPLAIGLPLLFAALFDAFLIGFMAIMKSQTRHIYSSEEALKLEAKARRAGDFIAMGGCYFLTILLCGGTVWLPFRADPSAFPVPFVLYSVLGGLTLLVFLGLAALRISNYRDQARKAALASGEAVAQVIGDRTEDRYWKWGGLVYSNPNDPAVWVEKRIGIGWTTNMARWQSWVWLALFIIVLPGVMVAVALYCAR